jgi:hypothetical protein
MKRRILSTAMLGIFGLVAFLQADEPQKQDPKAIFRFADADKNGKLSVDEFLKLMANAPKLKDNPELARQLFDRFDASKDSALQLGEFEKVVEFGAQQNGNAKPEGGFAKKMFFDKKSKLKGNEPEAVVKKPSEPAVKFVEKPATREQITFFESKIRPVLIEHCYKCHSADGEKIQGGLVVDSQEGLRKGGDTGAAVVPGDLNKSLLITAIRYKDDSNQMPPKGKLPESVIADFEAWVKMGAPDPRTGGPKIVKQEIDIEKGREFWAFQKPKSATIPQVQDAAWNKSELDRLIRSAQEKKGLAPIAVADANTLIRRVYFDLIGIPPTPTQVDAFVDQCRDGINEVALEKVIDELLKSAQFGERWGRHWLDVARFAETTGKSVNFNFPHAWRYRDYVIQAFNQDKPYHQFIQEQIAGDLMPAKDDADRAQKTIATGFLAIGPKSLNERNRLQFELDVVDEQIDTMSQAVLGITAACARCHDHKFDPIPMKDYYSLAGIFRSSETCYGTVRFVQANQPSPLIQLPAGSVPAANPEKLSTTEREKIESNIKDIQKRMAEAKDPLKNIFNFAQLSTQRSKLDSYEADGTPKLQAMGVRERFRTVDSPIYTRGESDKPGETVKRGMLQVVSKEQPKITKGSGRLELAKWLTSESNPLTARVYVNRVWLHLFGRGIVSTPDNFGSSGQAPSNQTLLDHLAVTFMKEGWSTKKLIKQIMLSHAYRLSTGFDTKNHNLDPDNELIWRMTPRRLDAEAIRDGMLFVSGDLNATAPVASPIGRAGEGPSARPQLGSTFRMDANDPHRAVYLPVVRDNLIEAMNLFDAADPSLVTGERNNTTVPAQALYLMNNPFVIKQSESAAKKLLAEATTDSERIRAAYRSFFSRSPTEKEMKRAEAFIQEYPQTLSARGFFGATPKVATWTAFCQALFASAEFLSRN